MGETVELVCLTWEFATPFFTRLRFLKWGDRVKKKSWHQYVLYHFIMISKVLCSIILYKFLKLTFLFDRDILNHNLLKGDKLWYFIK